jgi:lysophospholipase L1-like esterase
MKFFLSVCVAGGLSMGAVAQQKIDSSYNNTYYQGRMELFHHLPGARHAIVFLGNSITERAQWQELLQGRTLLNRGIGGDNTFGVLARLDGILADKPKKIFLDIGINDIGRGLPLTVIGNNYQRIIEKIRSASPGTKLFLQSVLPMNDSVLTAAYLKNKKDTVLALNRIIIDLAAKYGLTYVDLHNDVFKDGNGDLKRELTIDGIHLRPAAYELWVDYLKKKKYL